MVAKQLNSEETIEAASIIPDALSYSVISVCSVVKNPPIYVLRTLCFQQTCGVQSMCHRAGDIIPVAERIMGVMGLFL